MQGPCVEADGGLRGLTRLFLCFVCNTTDNYMVPPHHTCSRHKHKPHIISATGARTAVAPTLLRKMDDACWL